MGSPGRNSSLHSISFVICSAKSLRRIVWGNQPSPRWAAAPERRRTRPPDPDRWSRSLDGARRDGKLSGGPSRPVEDREVLGHRRRDAVDRLVEQPTPALVVRAHRVELLCDVSGTDAEYHPASRQYVESREFLRGPKWVSERSDIDV